MLKHAQNLCVNVARKGKVSTKKKDIYLGMGRLGARAQCRVCDNFGIRNETLFDSTYYFLLLSTQFSVLPKAKERVNSIWVDIGSPQDHSIVGWAIVEAWVILIFHNMNNRTKGFCHRERKKNRVSM